MVHVKETVAMAALTLLLSAVLFTRDAVLAARSVTYTVGDGFGWDLTIDMQSWARGKPFHARDTLIFKYDYQYREVVVTNQEGFSTCTENEKSESYDSGDDHIRLAFGMNFFISNVVNECQGGLKMAINATSPPPAARRQLK